MGKLFPIIDLEQFQIRRDGGRRGIVEVLL